jgi:hypothetical protein
VQAPEMSVSIVAPVFEEEGNLWPLHERIVVQALEPLGLAFEVVYVDDGSRDHSHVELSEIRTVSVEGITAPTVNGRDGTITRIAAIRARATSSASLHKRARMSEQITPFRLPTASWLGSMNPASRSSHDACGYATTTR